MGQNMDRLLRRASRLGISEATLREGLGASRGRFGNWKRPERDLPSDMFLKAAALVKCTVEELLGEYHAAESSHSRTVEEPAPPYANAPSRLDAATIVDAFARLLLAAPATQREHIVALCSTLARAPDSERVRAELAQALATTHPVPSWRSAAVTLVSRARDEGKHLPMDGIIAAVDQLWRAQCAEIQPNTAAAPATHP